MKKQTKRLLMLTFTLTLVILTAMSITLNVSAEEDDYGLCGENIEYTFDAATETLTIWGTGEMKNYSSSSKTPWYSYRSAIKTVRIENGITSIGNYAFEGCNSLTSITIPDSVISIGNRAFDGCRSMTNINIPDSISSIGKYVFYNCSGLTSITIPDGITSIGNYEFYACSSLTSITIPDSVTSIGNFAFQGCISLTSINIPDSVTSIGNSAFYVCESLTSITLGEGVKSIGADAFYGCIGLTSITIPDRVTSIGGSAFRNCSNLMSITLGEGIESIDNSAFYGCSSLTSITLSNGITKIGEGVFAECYKLEKIIYCGTSTEWNAIFKGYHWDYRAGRDNPDGTFTLQYHSYNYDDGVIITEPTHLTEGMRSLTCTICNKTQTESIPKLPDHTYGEWEKDDGNQHKKSCACGNVVYEVHKWNDGETTTAPTHLTEGIKTFTCPCGETKTRPIAKLPDHTYGDWEKHDGDQHKKSCECGNVVYEAHAWNEGEVTTAPTQESEGVKTFTCTVCGETKTDSVEQLPATTVATTEATAATQEPVSSSTTDPVTTTATVGTTASDSPSTMIASATVSTTIPSSGGCGSTVFGGIALISLISLAAITLLKKKEH